MRQHTGGMVSDIRLGTRRWSDIAAPTTLLVPVGSCEQHGPHLPVDTDTRIALAVADGAATQLNEVLVTPPVAFSASGEHAGFPGTLSIGTVATTAMLVELGRSADWAARVVFVNGHGGNLEAVRAAVELLRTESRQVTDWWPTGQVGDLHAGRVETSVMLHLAPDLVGPIPPAVAAPSMTALISDGVKPHSPSGVLGDPTGATAAEGARILSTWIDDLIEAVTGYDG